MKKDLLGQILFTISGAFLGSIPGLVIGMTIFANSGERFNGLPGYEGGGVLGSTIGIALGATLGVLMANKDRNCSKVAVLSASTITLLINIIAGFSNQTIGNASQYPLLLLLVILPLIAANISFGNKE